jgi:hypothetical protein
LPPLEGPYGKKESQDGHTNEHRFFHILRFFKKAGFDNGGRGAPFASFSFFLFFYALFSGAYTPALNYFLRSVG